MAEKDRLLQSSDGSEVRRAPFGFPARPYHEVVAEHGENQWLWSCVTDGGCSPDDHSYTWPCVAAVMADV